MTNKHNKFHAQLSIDTFYNLGDWSATNYRDLLE